MSDGLGWTPQEAAIDQLRHQVYCRIMDANSPTQIAVTRAELEACKKMIQERHGSVLLSHRRYVLFHNVELIPQ